MSRLHRPVLASGVEDIVSQEVQAEEVRPRVHHAAEGQLDGVRPRVHEVVAVLHIIALTMDHAPIRNRQHAPAGTALQARDLLHVALQRRHGAPTHQVPRLHRHVLAPREQQVPRGIARQRRDREAVRGVVLRLTPPPRCHLQALALLAVPDLDGAVEAAAEHDVGQQRVDLRCRRRADPTAME